MEGQRTSPRRLEAQGANPRATACVPCQRQKVRCIVENGKPPCRSCHRRNVACTFRKRLFDHGADEKSGLSAALAYDLRAVHAAVSELRQKQCCAPLEPLRSLDLLSQTSTTPSVPLAAPYPRESSPRNEFGAPDPENENIEKEVTEQSRRPSFNCDLSQAPISSLYHITRLRALRSQQLPIIPRGINEPEYAPGDIISNGLLARSDADQLVQAYLSRSDHYLYGIASKYQDLESIRKGSSLLLVAICTVSALQSPSGSELYRICHKELRRHISNFVFASTLNLEDLRGLCIACFWLSDLSWSVSGLAIRRAIEVDLQKPFYTVVKPIDINVDRSLPVDTAALNIAIEHVRLWYLLYICDQHLTILYGRTPNLQNQDTIRNCESYLAMMPGSVPDIRIVNQISLLRILNAVSELFGLNVASRVPVVFKPQLDGFIRQLDNWATHWLNLCSPHPIVGAYPSKAVSLHYHFAKLHVCSHVFRGLSSDTTVDPIPETFHEIALMAVQSAKSIVDLTIGDSDLKMAFVGVPHYFHTMIAYACSFLLKTALTYREYINIDVGGTFQMIEKVIKLCKETPCAQYHLIHWIGEGLQIVMSNCVNAASAIGPKQSQSNEQQMETCETLTPASKLSQQNQSQQFVSTTQDFCGPWDAASQATVFTPNNRVTSFPDYHHTPEGNTEIVGHLESALGNWSGDFAMDQWNPSVRHVHMEHFELGLGLL